MDTGLLRYKTFWLNLGAGLVDGTILVVLTTGLTAASPAGLGEFFVRSFRGVASEA